MAVEMHSKALEPCLNVATYCRFRRSGGVFGPVLVCCGAAEAPHPKASAARACDGKAVALWPREMIAS